MKIKPENGRYLIAFIKIASFEEEFGGKQENKVFQENDFPKKSIFENLWLKQNLDIFSDNFFNQSETLTHFHISPG